MKNAKARIENSTRARSFILRKAYFEIRSAIAKITSLSFAEGETIPRKCSRDGGDKSPPLHIEDVPSSANKKCDKPVRPVVPRIAKSTFITSAAQMIFGKGIAVVERLS